MSLLFDTDKIGPHKQDKRSIKAIAKAHEVSEKRRRSQITSYDALVKATLEPSKGTLLVETLLDEVHERVLKKLTSLSDTVAIGDRHLNSKLMPRLESVERTI